MPTRYYFSTKVPQVRVDGACRGTWARQSVFSRSWSQCQWTWVLVTDKTLAGVLGTRDCRTNQQGNYDWHFARWMTRPLAATTVTGTFDFIGQIAQQWEDAILPPANSVVARWKVHVYVTVGQTTAVRHTLLTNYVDGNNFPFATLTAVQITQQTVTAGAVVAGDCVMVEIGMRIVSSPTPAVTYPPSNLSAFPVRLIGATGSFPGYTILADMASGNTATNLAPWCEFSHTFTAQAASAPPANETCATAIVIPPALPYQSPWIDTTGGTQPDQEIFWTWTAPSSGKVFFHTAGGNYKTQLLGVFTGACGALVTVPTSSSVETAMHRSMTTSSWNAVGGTVYTLRVRTGPDSVTQAPSGGGSARLGGFYVDGTPDVDDLYLPCGWLVALRAGQLVNLTPIWFANALSAIAIDYTRRPMDDLAGGTNTSERVWVGLHDNDLAEALDIADFHEVDFIDLPWRTLAFLKHPATFHLTRAGTLFVGWFGNGYLFVKGVGVLPAILNTVSSAATFKNIRSIDATHADLQAGAPWPAASEHAATPQVTSPWGITIDENTGILYYTSAGFYEPVGGDTIKRWNLNSGTQMADLVTLALQGAHNPGLKGLQVVAGMLFVCNGTVVHRLDPSTGALLATYTPSVSDDSQSLCDVKVNAAGDAIYVVDENTTAIFKFNIATGVEAAYWQPYLLPGSLTQMAIYQPMAPTDVGTTVTPIRIRRAPHQSNEQGWIFYPALQIDLEAGRGLDGGAMVQGHDPQMMLRWSDDGGHTWSTEHWRSGGKIGEYKRRAIWRRLGRSRDRVFEVRVSDPIAWHLMQALLLDPEPGTS